MDGNNNHNTPQYPYNPYYYHPQYYTNYSQQQQQQHQHVPQGDPSAALSSMMYQLQQQTQQRQAMGALAAASISNTLGNSHHQQDHYAPVEYYADYYAVHDQRSMINYNDITHASAATAAANVTAPSTETTVNENDPSPKKPKFCCNRWLKSAIAVAQHEKLHIQCPSCDHMCLKSALQEHEEIAHGKERIETNKKPSRPDGVIPPNAPRIDTPEELAAWIAARKKNWPSKDNVERKEQEMAEKEARGELPVNNKKRKANDRNKQQNKKIKIEESSLVDAQYDSDSDSDDIMDPERDAISSKDPSAMGKILLPEDKPKRRCRYFTMGKCKRGDECGFSHEKPEPRPKQPKNAPVFKKRPNLLFKLLEKDIMQEKSVILQCLRYIADNKFFGKGGDAVDVPLKEESNVPKIVDEKEDSVMDTSGVMEETLASSAPVEQPVEAVVAEEKKAGEEDVSVDQEQTITECDTALLEQ